ncbi:helix-turn-helix transcriptional regulator [Streptomyces sp. SDr-06]|uniref:helix-turn-helix transcriptional regulator n=1 Tax=Streptomyces sp. SDr-06 TaxID=2267702 RepID=UPI00167B8705|nr:AlpA family phage regulatory protein [Streptomyces sp. SDr-06]
MPKPRRTPQPPPPGFVWIDKAVELTGLAKSTLYKYRQRGAAPQSVTIARKVAYRLTVIDEYLDNLDSPHAEPSVESRPPEPRKPRKRRVSAVK